MIEYSNKNINLWIIGGPTASGKSAYAISLAQQLSHVTGKQSVIINADAMQVYQHLPILTAQPHENVRAGIVHKLYSYVPLTARFSLMRWMNDAAREIKDCWHNNQNPILVGGSGLYIKRLLEGVVQVPEIEEQILLDLKIQHKNYGLENLYSELQNCDPEIAIKIKPNDSQRIIRALSVYRGTNRPLTWWKNQPPLKLLENVMPLKIFINTDRNILHANISQRLKNMLENGAIEEVRAAISNHGLSENSTAWAVLGIKTLCQFLENKIDLIHAETEILHATRQYAKRQITWFRHQFEADIEINMPADKNFGNNVHLFK